MPFTLTSLTKAFTDLWSRQSLSRRVAILAAVLVSGTALIEGALLVGVSSHVVSSLESDRVEQRLKSAATQLTARISEFRKVPLILAGTPPIERIVVLYRGGEPELGESLEVWRQRLAIIFRSMVEAEPSLQQVRLIGVDHGGREIVRVNRLSEDHIEIVADDKLQLKGNREYFEQAIALSKGGVYLSQIDANVEHGQVERPFKPMIRAATPIYSPSGEVFGAIVVNAAPDYWMRDVSSLGNFTKKFFRKLMLVNHAGDCVFRTDGGPIFGTHNEFAVLFQQEWPRLAPLLKPNGPKSLRLEDNGHVFAATKVNFDPSDPSKFAILATDADASAVFGGTGRLIALGSLAALILSALGLLAAFFVTRPLKGLMAEAKKIAEGKVDRSELEKGDPDLLSGELGEALQVMKTAVENRDASLRRSEAHLRAIVDNTIDGLITIDAQGLIRRFNPACEKIFGYTAEEALGRNVSLLMPRADADHHDAYMERYSRTGEARFIGVQREVKGRHKSGQLIDLEVAISEIRVENELMFSGAIRDITERKNIERLKSEFISTVSHELRTPLTSILGALSLLRSGNIGPMSENATRMIELAYANGGRLSALINDILDTEKIEAGAVEFKQTPEVLREVVQESVDHMSNYATSVGVGINVGNIPADIILDTDRDRLLQVLANLLSNAVKFSPRGGTVSVSAVMHGETVRVSVADDGPGIPDSFRPRIFQKFAQADASDSRQKGGTGLGLSITKSIIERLGGEIGFETEAGAGTTFYFDLPARRGAPEISDIKRSA